MYHSITAQDVGPRPAISPVAAPRMGRVLVVEDDLDRRRAIVAYLTDEKGVSTLSIGSATNGYSAYPIAPRQWFLTLSAAY